MMSDSWEKLKSECQSCTGCELHKTRTNCVFGTGNVEADILFVGEAPGDNEDKTGIPFVGRAGQLLDQYLYAVDIPRESVYIANILKCRPPKNRDPLPDEEDACIDFLRRSEKSCPFTAKIDMKGNKTMVATNLPQTATQMIVNIANGKGVRVSSKQELDALFA